MNTRKNSRIVKKPDVRRQEIVETAMQLFLEKGFEQTSTADVMRALKIAKGTIYHYFRSKDELMEAVVDHMADDFVQRRIDAIAAVEGDAVVKIQALFAREHESPSESRAVEHLHAENNVRLHTRLLAVLVEKMAPPFADLIQEGCDTGQFEVERPLETAEILLAGIQFLTDDAVYSWDDATVTRRSRAFPFIVESMLGAPQGSFTWLARTAKDAGTDEPPRNDR